MSGIKMLIQYYRQPSGLVLKWWSENQTKYSPLFKWHLNTGPFGDRTTINNLNTRLV